MRELVRCLFEYKVSVGASGVALLELLSIDWIVKSIFSYE